MSTTRSTMKHAAVYSAAAMAGRMIGFFMLPFYAHILQGHGYAVIGMIDVGLGFLLALMVYGLQGSIIRLYHDEKDPARKPVVVSTGIILIGTVTAVLSIPLLLLSKPIAAFLIDDAGSWRYVVLALLAFNLDMMGQAASSWLLVRSRSTLFSLLSLFRLFTGLSLNIYLILVKGMGLDGYFISSLLTNLVSCLIFVGIAFRQCGREFDPGIALTIRRFLLPLIPGAMASWVGRQVERIMVKGMINLESVGVLEMGYKFPVLLAILITRPFMKSWETRRFEIADEPGASGRIARMYTYYIFLMVYAGLVMAVIIKPMLDFLTPSDFDLSYRIARIEIVTVILQGAGFHLLFGLAYAKNTAMISKLRGGAAAVKVLLSWFFISTWGIYGAAFSAAVVGLLTNILVFHFAQKHYRLDLEWKALAFIAAAAAGVFLTLDNWDYAATPVYGALTGDVLPWLREGLARTFLGTWMDGKVITALGDRTGLVAEMAMKGPLAALFIVVLPIIHPSTRRRWAEKWRARFGPAPGGSS